MWKVYNKTIIEFGFRMISWIIKTSCLCYLPKIAQTSVLIIHDIMLNLIQKDCLFSGIELTCEFLRTMLNHNQFLLSVVSYSFNLFGEFEEVLILKGKSDAYKWLICIVRALLCPSWCQKLDQIFFCHLLCWNATTFFVIRLLTLCVFLQRSEILYWENKSHQEFRELKQHN